MAAISANLLAAAAPSLSRLLNLAAQTAGTTQPALVTGFANFLTQATATASTTTTPGTATTTEAGTEATDSTDGSEVAAAVLAAIGLVPQQLPTQLPTVTVDATGGSSSQSLASSIPLDPAVNLPAPTTDGTSSRSVELQLNTAPLIPGSPETTPILTPSGLTETADEVPALPELTTGPPPTTTGSPVAATPGEVVAAAARTPAVAPQTPLVVDRSQLLPAQPAEIGYGLVGPTVNGPPAVNPVTAVGGTPSQAQVEQIATTLPPVEPTPAPIPTDTAAPVQPFSRVLAGEISSPAPGTTAPVSQVVTAPQQVTPQPVATEPGEPNAPAVVPEALRETPSLPETAPVATYFPAAAVPVLTPTVVEPTSPVEAAEAGATQIAPPSTNTAPAEAPTAAPPRVAPTAPPVASQLSDAFVTHARVIESGGTHEFQLRLDPPELGEVKVRVLAMGDRIEARLVVSDDAVKRLIESQLPELRQRLEAAGVNVPSFDVSTDGGGKRADTGGDGWDRSQPALAPTRRPAGPPRLTPPHPNTPGGRLDVTA